MPYCLLLFFYIENNVVVFGISTVWLTAASEETSSFVVTLVSQLDDHRATTLLTESNLFVRFDQIDMCREQSLQTAHLITVFY